MKTLRKLHAPRMTDWLIVTLLLVVVIYQVAPQQLPVSIYKLSLITMAAVAAYWIDRSAFPYASPSDFMTTEKIETLPSRTPPKYMQHTHIQYEIAFAACLLRRAIIIGSAMLGASLGA